MPKLRRGEKKERKVSKKKPSNGRFRFVAFLFLASALITAAVVRPPGLAMITYWPLALWTPLVLFPYLPIRWRGVLPWFVASLVIWLGAMIALRDPGWVNFIPVAEKQPGAVRVVTFNCAGGTETAVMEALQVEGADIWLLQEVAGENQIKKLITKNKLKLHVISGPDTAIVSRLPLSPMSTKGNGVAADIQFANKKRVRVVSLRLQPPVLAFEFWSQETRQKYTDDAPKRLEELEEILQSSMARTARPALVGGDFNTNDRHALSSAFAEWNEADWAAGRGWPGTGINDFPFARVDQLWSSPEVKVLQSYVVKSQHSDHRMVIGDYLVE